MLSIKGTMDGSVAVYNIMLPPSAPQYRSDDVIQKHEGIVWEVCLLLIKKFNITFLLQFQNLKNLIH